MLLASSAAQSALQHLGCCPRAAAAFAAAALAASHSSGWWWSISACAPQFSTSAAAGAASSTDSPQQQQQQQQHMTQPQRLAALIEAGAAAVPAAFRSGRLLSPDEAASLALLRRYPLGQPGLRNQVILAKVLRVAPKQLLVDPGYYGLAWVPRQELASATAHDAAGRPIQRQSAAIHPGEFVKVRLACFETPFGEPQLEPVSTPHEVRTKLVWQQLEYRMQHGLPVQGRILNATAGGFAVAVAGYVALLPHGQAEASQKANIGVLQEFTIHSLDHRRRLIKLSGTKSRRLNMDDLRRTL